MKWLFTISHVDHPEKPLRRPAVPLTYAGEQRQTGQLNTLLYQAGHVIALATVVFVWITSLANVDLNAMTDLGLISVLPMQTYAALAVLILSFGILVARRHASEFLLFLHVVILIFILHGTPAILYGTLRYSWAWKHLGIVDYIQRYGSVNPDIQFMSAYHNWPGFFTLSAFVTDTIGVASPLGFAIWAPVCFNLLYLGALRLIFRAFSTDQRLTWLAIWVFYLTNWVGQDYYSPQALSYFLHLVILGICLTWFQVSVPPSPTALKRWLGFERLATWFHTILTRTAATKPPEPAGGDVQQNGFLLVVLLIFSVIASSHQITPFMTICAVAALVIFQQCRMRMLPLMLIIITQTWIIFGARAFMGGAIDDLLSTVGQVRGNLDANLIDIAQASSGQMIVAFVGRGLTLGVLVLAFLGGIRRLWSGHRDLSAALLTITPFAILAGGDYGGEIVFRVYLFAIPFLAFFVAALVYPDQEIPTIWGNRVATIVLSSVLLASFLFPYYGKERQYYFTPDEVAAAEYLYTIAPKGALLIDVTHNYPWQFRNYEYYTPVSIAWEGPESLQEVLKNPAQTLSLWMRNPRYSDAYLIITRSQKAEIDASGALPKGTLDQLEQALLASQEFEVVYENKDARIFRLARRLQRITQNELAATEYLYAIAPRGSLIIDGTMSYRENFQANDHYTYMTLSNEPVQLRQAISERPVQVLSEWMRDPRYTDAYLIITRSQKAELDATGILPMGELGQIEQALLRSRTFRLIYENEDARIFVLAQKVRN